MLDMVRNIEERVTSGSLEAEEGSGANYHDASTTSSCYSNGSLSSSGNISPLSPRVGGRAEVSNNYCLEGEDQNTTKAADKAELFEKLNAHAPNIWFTDKETGDVRLLWELNVSATPEAVTVIVNKYIPATGNSEYSKHTDPAAPENGDSSDMILWMILLFAAGSGILGASIYQKRKKNI